MFKRLTFLLVALCLGASVALLASEAAYRVSTHFVCVRGHARVYQPDLELGWLHEPSASGEHVGCAGSQFEFRNEVKINSAGLHDVERGAARPAPAGRRGVLVLGDSMTEALQVPLESNFVRLVQNLPEMDDTVLWNAGTALYGPDNNLRWYRHYGRRYEPDDVVFVWNLANDVAEVDEELFVELYRNHGVGVQPVKPYAHLAEDGQVVFDDSAMREHLRKAEELRRFLRAMNGEPGWWEWARQKFYLLRRLHEFVVGEARAAGGPSDSEANAAEAASSAASDADAGSADPGYPSQFEIYFRNQPARWERAWALEFALIDELAREVAADGARFSVLLLPPKLELKPNTLKWYLESYPAMASHEFDLGKPRRRALAWLATRSFAWEDATPDLDAVRLAGTTPFFAMDPHLTEAGHEGVAKALARLLARVEG